MVITIAYLMIAITATVLCAVYLRKVKERIKHELDGRILRLMETVSFIARKDMEKAKLLEKAMFLCTRCSITKAFKDVVLIGRDPYCEVCYREAKAISDAKEELDNV